MKHGKENEKQQEKENENFALPVSASLEYYFGHIILLIEDELQL